MIFLFQWVNIVLLLIIFILPFGAAYFFVNYMKDKDLKKDSIEVRLKLLEARVAELEDYINRSE